MIMNSRLEREMSWKARFAVLLCGVFVLPLALFPAQMSLADHEIDLRLARDGIVARIKKLSNVSVRYTCEVRRSVSDELLSAIEKNGMEVLLFESTDAVFHFLDGRARYEERLTEQGLRELPDRSREAVD